MSSFTIPFWRNRLYQTEASRWPMVSFLSLLEAQLDPSMRVLDVGAGAGDRNTYQLRGKCREIVGVDRDPRVMNNPLLDRGYFCESDSLPFEDASFDLAFSIYVLEHVEAPTLFAKEIRRVLRPGGRFLALTPNFLHYVSLISWMTPTTFHKWLNQKRGRPAKDTHPTFYRMNTPSRLRGIFETEGFDTKVLEMIEVEPHYLEFSLASYFAGAAYERIVNSTDALAGFRVNILSCFERGR